MKVVITGAAGFLGRGLVDVLARKGHEVVALRHEDVDLDGDDAVPAVGRHLGADVVLVHLAARHPIDPATTTAVERRALLDTNVHGTMRLLEACRDRGAARVVFASTVEVVGSAGAGVVDETSRVSPLSDLAATKLAGEDHLRVLGQEAGVPWVALRLAAVYGPRQRPRAGVAAMIEQAASGRAVRLAGPGDDLVDVLFVDDAVAALALAVQQPAADGIVAITSGERHRVSDLARAVHAATGIEAEVEVAGAESVDAARARGGGATPRPAFHTSIGRARGVLGYEPSVDLTEGIARTVAWIRARRP